MRKDNGLIRDYKDVEEETTKEERKRDWSKPFSVGDIVEIYGVRVELIKVKKMRKELHFRFAPEEVE